VTALVVDCSALVDSYVALAEALDVPLLTSDEKLSRAAAQYCDVIASA
jgi:predicted nucleic acid-binding protein